MRSDEGGWPLERVLDTVGLVLAATVVVRGIGGLVAAAGVSSFHVNLGATSGSGLVVRGGLPLPASVRLEYGTSWADPVSGLALLGAVGLVALPRMVWAGRGNERWSRLPGRSVMGIGAVATVTAVSGLIGTVNWAWNASRLAGPAEAVNLAAGVSATALAVLCAALSWIALPRLTEVQGAGPAQGRRPDRGRRI